MARRYNNSQGQYQTPFQTPQGQQRKNDEFSAHLLSSASSIQTDDSFLSQVPLPYHMKEDQSQMPRKDARFAQDPIRPSPRGSQSQIMTQSQDARFGQGPNRPSSRGSRAYMGYGNQRRPVSFAPIMEDAEIEEQTPVQTYAQGISRRLSNIQGPPPAGPSFGQYNQQDQNQHGSNHGSSHNPYGGSNRGSNHGSKRGSDYGYDNRGNDNSNARMPRHMSLGNISSHYPTRQHEEGHRMSNVQSPFLGFVQGPPKDYDQGPPQGWGSQYDYRSSYHQGQYKGYQDQGFHNQSQARCMSAGLNQGGDGDHGQIDSGGPTYPYTWNQNRFVRSSSNCEDGPSGFAGGQCGRYFKDPDFMVNKNAHERRRSVAGTPCYSNPLFNTHNGRGHNNKRRSLGDEAVMKPAPMVANNYTGGSLDFQYEEDEDTFIGSAINTPTQGRATLPAPTPRTARELGDAVTPSHPMIDTAKALELSVVKKETPPGIGLDSIEESPTKRGGSHNIQDPFNLIALPGHIAMAKGAGLNRGWSTTALSADENQCKVVGGQNHPSFIIGGPITTGPSPQLAALCPDGRKPTVAVAFDPINMPFVETARLHPTSAQTGVVHVFNIPFKCSTQDILSIFGRGARLIAEEPVHVIMERVTSKTMDAFVEFETIEAAINAVDHFEQHRMNGNRGKLGARHVILEVCGHEVLMKCLFPKAKSVKWRGTYPEIIKETDKYNTGFKGFVSREELVMLVKHIEHPARAPFSMDCPQRPYECLISTLLKYPWNRVDVITVADRDALFSTTLAVCKHMVYVIGTYQYEQYIDGKLLRRVQNAVFNCNGFTEAQKDDLAFTFMEESINCRLPPYAEYWYIFKAITCKRGWAPDVILFYIAVLREASTAAKSMSLADRAAKGHQTKLANPFGDLQIDYPADVASMTLAEVGALEWDAIEALLRRVLPSY